ncbi:MAG: hypothetical protein PHW32_03715 [Bacilli bacterium]|nr:hypothetical protein [Bacilli bacterium]MDD4282446.1 hypothetical protein [Bacilli bacterium]MDD4718917.1 hypothetical protein [Bacilli bacterium]
MNGISLNDCISKINIDNEITKILTKNNILKIEDLWNLKRNDLKKFGLSSPEIKHIKIKMQLYGLDLNKKKYNKN